MVYFYYYLHQFLNNNNPNNPEIWVYTIISYDDLHNIHNMRKKN